MNSIEDFHKLRQKCVISGKLYKDPNFLPSANILGHESGHKSIIWRRPHEICTNPRFVVDGYSRFDVHQGSLGDCWFLAALATLAENEELFHKVVSKENSCSAGVNYAGIFHFR
jgi:Calpain family cysteine protease